MGWGSGVHVFDNMCEALLEEHPPCTKKEYIRLLIVALEDCDWDTQQDSNYWDHPVVREAMKEEHPDWFEEGE